ncbi:MAG: hypothetical protein GXO11_05265 [Epsilonproteobacteria bacterium]|nr:hypothetical protein [Campylobacterota bacterium]
MLYTYIISRWLFYVMSITFIIIMLLQHFLNSIDERYINYILLLIIFFAGIFVTVLFKKEDYSEIDKKSLYASKRFENSIAMIVVGHFLVLIMMIVFHYQPVLSFFGLPFAIFIGILYIKGFSTAQDEIEKYKGKKHRT